MTTDNGRLTVVALTQRLAELRLALHEVLVLSADPIASWKASDALDRDDLRQASWARFHRDERDERQAS